MREDKSDSVLKLSWNGDLLCFIHTGLELLV